MMRETLRRLAAEDNLRTLPEIGIDGKYVVYEGRKYLNLSSNDYLGLSCSGLHREFMRRMTDGGNFLLSNPSSRLITGNSPDYGRLEMALSELFGGRAVLVVGCGYMVNSGVLPAVTGKGDLVLADKLVHASLIDGLRLCEADWKRFNHNDTGHLERLLAAHRRSYRNVWIVTESIFSMDGDRAPLKELAALRREAVCRRSARIRGLRAAGMRSRRGDGRRGRLRCPYCDARQSARVAGGVRRYGRADARFLD